MADKESASFARTNRTGDAIAELRADSPVWVLAVFDAVAMSEQRSTGQYVSRTSVIVHSLTEIAQKEIDRASLVLTLAGKQSEGTGDKHEN
jgi:hypothetical protein